MLDWNPSFWRLGMEGLAIFADGVDEVRKAVRQNIREGCDVIKMYVTGEGLLRGRPGIPPEETMYSLEEIEVAVREAHTRNRQIAGHVRGDDGVKLFVTDMGFSPMEALVAATKHGSELMRTEKETGTIEVGKLADLLVVDGDPLDDIAILQDRSKLAMVMKDGEVMVNTLGLPQELQPLPDFTMDIEWIQRAKAGIDPMPSAAEVQH